ncbi:hypothetical protein [Hydrogenophaga sp.]|uniref:hypothetical protein n=1 Tax=Hydrogenophaga sp. TaxID=1904254 RepID=UPI003D2E5878
MRITTPQEFLEWPVPEEMTEYPSMDLKCLRDTVERTLPNIETYLNFHNFKALGPGAEPISATVKLGIARLEWLLDEAREDISELFTQEEFVTMLNCYQGAFLTPWDCHRMEHTVAQFMFIDWEEREESVHADFINRLHGLTTLQRAALADALEVGWQSAGQGFDALVDMNVVFR